MRLGSIGGLVFRCFTDPLTASSDGPCVVSSHSFLESFFFLSGVPFVLVVVLLGGVAGNTNRQLDFQGLEVSASGLIAILHTLTVMGKTSFAGTRLTCSYGLERVGVAFFCRVRMLSLVGGSIQMFPSGLCILTLPLGDP